jgi:thioredoxin 2
MTDTDQTIEDMTAARAATSGPAAGPASSGSAAAGPVAGGPVSVLTCTSCGKKNKIRPSSRGTPHCGSCSEALPWVVNATDATFGYEARASVAVLVDLWAPWCGPCRVVGPMLEALAREYAGRIKVVKVDVDQNPMLAGQFGASSIPTMIVIKGERVVDRIVGAVPPSDLKMRLFPYLMRT